MVGAPHRGVSKFPRVAAFKGSEPHLATFSPAPILEVTRTQDVVYGRKFGFALTLDVLQPAKPNGFGIVCIVSGAWKSNHDWISAHGYAPYLERGYTVFAVCHACQPRFTIPDITEDVNRAVRFVRHNAAHWNVDPNKLGVYGSSAGAHLSLTLGTSGGPGKADAKDPVERESSAVQCVACFFPPSDFLNYGAPGVDAVGTGPLKDLHPAFLAPGAEDTPESRQKLGHEISPFYHITAQMPPTLIMHGDADPRVPLEQSQHFVQKATETGATAKLIIKPGGGHSWPDLVSDMAVLADWFDQYLRGIKK